MNERCFPCGARLDCSSCVRPLKSPCLRMFMSIRTLKSLSTDQNVCNVCRHSYIKWKSENSAFSAMLDHFENDIVVINDDANSDSYELMDVQVQADDSSRLTTVENPTLITTTNHQDRDFIFFSRNIWIPEGTRCCSGHLINNLLSKDAVDQIKPFSIRYQELSSSDVQLLLSKAQTLFENGKKRFSFDDPRDLNDDEYCLLTSLSRDHFTDFVQITSSSIIRPSCNRSIRTAVGIFLCKLRLGISNRLLACMFQIADKRTVSRIINSARQAIVKSFVPDNLGFGHVTREDVIGRHTAAIARELMCGGDSTDTTIIIIDGAYLYIQSRNNEFQRKTFNLYKKRSLLKPMMIVTTTGYIVACIGPFMTDFNNNDAAIMKDILLRNTDHILSWLKEHDTLVVDRGLRDSIGVMKALVLEATMTSFLDGRRQFSVEEANESRCITKIRWIVEAANRRLKQFKYFASTIQNSSLVYLESDMSIACALINHYQSPMTRSKLEDEEIGVQIMQLRQQKNKIQLLLEENNLIKRFSLWEIINHTEIIDGFPIMTQDDLGDLTFGVFQLKRARSYAEERCSTTNLTSDIAYSVHQCKIIPNWIRIPTQSAHSNRVTYHPTIHFTDQAILASAIWFLSHQRWQTQQYHMPLGEYKNLATDLMQVSDFYDPSDDDDSQRYTLT
ncbi:unnamed protein product [Rotaria socialis]|uniref:DDE Tnp4 domain-containing protein n=1 Tax=Rotaria socialis TaxID=392032 RepID=A0A821A4C7_9BILA|nr:unnamed protein product [Rotaria socialis]